MKGVRCCQVHRLVAVWAASLLLLSLYDPSTSIVRGWSGCDAYTIVILKSFDTDPILQEQFYNAPSGTPFSISREGYRVIDAPTHFSAPPRQNANDNNNSSSQSVHVKVDDSSVSAGYPLDPTLSTGIAYKGMQASDAPLPYRGRLSGKWVLWTKEAPAHDAVETGPLLLHCRLPLPQNRTETQRQQRRYIAQYKAALSEALELWWHTAPSEHASRCLYGDGEKALTGAERYYELCPRGTVVRVQHHRLATLLRGSATEPAGGTRKMRKQRNAGSSPSVLDFLHQMHESPSSRNAILRNPRYRGVFEEIGQYHPRYSKPRWNTEYLVWESWYPSTRPCATHYTTISSVKDAPSPVAAAANVSRSRRRIHPEDPYWKTVVRFRCPPQPQADGSHTLSTWTITEARQLCEYHVELMSELVCGWEQELDSFNVNPVPCVVLE
jgi:hypothetical protein